MKTIAIDLASIFAMASSGAAPETEPVVQKSQPKIATYCDPPTLFQGSYDWTWHVIAEVTAISSIPPEGTDKASYIVTVVPRETVVGALSPSAVEVRFSIPQDGPCTPASGERIPYVGEPLRVYTASTSDTPFWQFIVPYTSHGIGFDEWQRSR